MAKKITDLAEITSASATDLLMVISGSSGINVNKKITIENFIGSHISNETKDWIPVLTQGNQTPTISGYTAKYIQLGNWIYLWGNLPIQSGGEGGQLVLVTGLPVSSALPSWINVGSFFAMDYGTGIIAGVVQIVNDSGWKLYFSTQNANNWLGVNPAWTVANQDYITFIISYLI